jgi:hypothetical protein
MSVCIELTFSLYYERKMTGENSGGASAPFPPHTFVHCWSEPSKNGVVGQ